MVAKEYIISLIILCSTLVCQDWDYSADIAEIKTANGVKIKNFQGWAKCAKKYVHVFFCFWIGKK